MIRKISLLLLGCLVTATLALAKHPKVSRDLDEADTSASVDVIVQFHQVPSEIQHQKVRDRGGNFKKDLALVKAGAYSLPPNKLSDLANDPNVDYWVCT